MAVAADLHRDFLILALRRPAAGAEAAKAARFTLFFCDITIAFFSSFVNRELPLCPLYAKREKKKCNIENMICNVSFALSCYNGRKNYGRSSRKKGYDMKYLLVLTTASLATMKVSFQGAFAKKGVRSSADGIFFNMLIFAASALLFLPYLFKASGAVLLCGAIYAVCNVSFQLTYTRALAAGNVSVAVMFANFGMLVPILLSCILYGDRPSGLRIAGIALTAMAFLVTVKRGNGKGERRYLVFALLAMLLNGASLSVQKIVGAQGIGGLSFVAASYLACTVLSGCMYAACALRGNRKSFKITRRPILAAIGAGCSLALYLAVNTYAAGKIDGSFHYPAHSGGSILLSTLVGVVLFKDKLSKRQIAACVLGLAAIVLMNF